MIVADFRIIIFITVHKDKHNRRNHKILTKLFTHNAGNPLCRIYGNNAIVPTDLCKLMSIVKIRNKV